jgi:hypothetical protein
MVDQLRTNGKISRPRTSELRAARGLKFRRLKPVPPSFWLVSDFCVGEDDSLEALVDPDEIGDFTIIVIAQPNRISGDSIRQIVCNDTGDTKLLLTHRREQHRWLNSVAP